MVGRTWPCGHRDLPGPWCMFLQAVTDAGAAAAAGRLVRSTLWLTEVVEDPAQGSEE